MSLPITWKSAGQPVGPRRALLPDGRDIVDQRVKPNVGHKASSNGRGMPHSNRSFGREIHRSLSGSFRNSSTCFLAEARKDEVLVRPQVVDEPVLVRAQLEEIVRLDYLRHLAKNLRPGPIRQTILFLEELFLARACRNAVFRPIDFRPCREALQDLADDPLVPVFPWCG